MRAGAPWGEPAGDAPAVDVSGDDADLAEAALAHPGAVLRFVPSPGSDLARAVGLGPDGPGGDTVVACDLLDLGAGAAAVNAAVLGVPPDRLRRWHRLHSVSVEVDGRVVWDAPATTVVVANGQFLRGRDLVPRGHPGDGRVEVQVYALEPGERAGMRTRLARGDHVPHPRIGLASGRRVVVRWADADAALEVDGRPRGRTGGAVVAVREGGARVLI
jgi:hypothetical protein